MVEFLKGLVISTHDAMVVYVDNQGGISVARNPVFHNCSKHIDIQYQCTRRRKIALEYLLTKEMLADLVTKPLPHAQHQYLACGIGVF